MDNHPAVSVIIPCFNESVTLPLVLNALNRQHYPGVIEVIVVDNGSTDDTFSVAQSFDVIVEKEKRKSSYLARNLGLQRASYSWIAFLDGDCIPCKNWLLELIECAIASGSDYLAGHINFTTDHLTLANELLAYRHSIDVQRTYVEKFSCVAGGNMLIGRHIFDQLGFFLPVFSGGDIEFSKRAAAVGFQLAYAENATVIHQSDFTNLSYLRRAFRIRYGQEITHLSESPIRHWISCLVSFPWRPGFRAGSPIAVALNIEGVEKVGLWAYLWGERFSDYYGAVCGSFVAALKLNKDGKTLHKEN